MKEPLGEINIVFGFAKPRDKKCVFEIVTVDKTFLFFYHDKIFKLIHHNNYYKIRN